MHSDVWLTVQFCVRRGERDSSTQLCSASKMSKANLRFEVQKNLISYVYWNVNHLDSWIKRDQLDVTCFLFHYLMPNMFRMLKHPSSGACDLFVHLFHELYCSGSMCVGVTLWFGWVGLVSGCRQKHCFSLHPDKWHQVGLFIHNFISVHGSTAVAGLGLLIVQVSRSQT